MALPLAAGCFSYMVDASQVHLLLQFNYRAVLLLAPQSVTLSVRRFQRALQQCTHHFLLCCQPKDLSRRCRLLSYSRASTPSAHRAGPRV